MSRIKEIIKNHKVISITIVLIVLFGLVISVPSLAKLKNRNTIYSATSWDGTVATSYKKGSGTSDNPYVISSSSEFAFFVEQLKTTDYAGIYFELGGDIVINSGIFDYNESEGLKYIVDGIGYYVKEYTNEYYNNVNCEGNPVGKVNISESITSFKGSLNGNSFTIFGLYISNSVEENLALFKNLSGTLTDIYITNSVVYGIGNVSGIAVNSENSSLTNVVYDGFVINNNLSEINENSIEDISITATLTETNQNLVVAQSSIDGIIKSIKLSGEYRITEIGEETSTNTIKINGVDIISNIFEIELGTSLSNELPIVTTTTIDGTIIDFINLKYQIEYYDDITSGVIANSKNTVLTNVINKSDVYGNYISAGLIGNIEETLNIVRSYNTGNISSYYISGGLIGVLKNNSNTVELINVYNKGEISSTTAGGLISLISDNTGIININNSINASSNYALNTVLSSTINIKNSYSSNGLSVYNDNLNESFPQISIENLYTVDFMTNLSYNEFISFEDVSTNLDNSWIYEKNSLPILYIDNLNSPIANINLNKYSWNNLSTELNIIGLTNNITFSIEDVSATNPVKEKYYYITNSRVPLTETELNNITTWLPYEELVTIEESGYYVVYAKILDMNDEVTYINTDIIALDISGFETNISMDDKVWTSFKTDLDEIYLSKDINLTIIASSDLITINSVQYYISEKELTEDELNSISEWISYTNYITINTPGKYVVYAKIIHSDSEITYINTDYLLYNGYKETLYLGNINKDYQTNYINNKSSITLTFEGDFELSYKDGYTHNLISNVLLPAGTELTLIDKSSNKLYKKTIETEEDLYGYNDSCAGFSSCSKYATYSFNLFKEIGKTNYYDETVNYGKTITNEKYIIIIDFKNTTLVDNYYDLSFYLSIKNTNNEYLYQTLNNTIKNINIYSTINDSAVVTTHSLTSDYANQTVYYNSDSELSINFLNEINYSVINNKNVIDTTYENKKSGLIIKLYNEADVQINRQYLDNILFEVDGKEYFSNSDNCIKINLGSVIANQNNVLKIKTKENSSGLNEGSYYIKISKFISEDGYYYDSLYTDDIIIPVMVENQEIIIPEYSFNVEMNEESIILDKKLETHLVTFNITYFGTFERLSLKISLYEKSNLTAYKQDYKLINLSQYTNDAITQIGNYEYWVDMSNPIFNLNLMPNKFNNNGYKYVFELFDGFEKIGKIEKYFIVR